MPAAWQWSPPEFCFWVELQLKDAVGFHGDPEPSGPGFGEPSFLGGGIRTSRVETYVLTVQNLEEAMKEFYISGHTMTQMAAHPLARDAVTWMLKLLGIMTQHRKHLVPRWLAHCQGAVATAVGVPSSLRHSPSRSLCVSYSLARLSLSLSLSLSRATASRRAR
jgi:hypothetical protein